MNIYTHACVPVHICLYTILYKLTYITKCTDACMHTHFLNCQGLVRKIGVGNDIPLQYSCLENPMDGGAWWAAVHGVAKSRT